MIEDARRPATLRLFIALVPDQTLQQALGQWAKILAERRSGRAVPADNIHMTLAFLGDVATARVDALESIIAALPRDAFSLRLDRIGAFKGADVAWVGPTTMPPQLVELHAALATALRDHGFRVEERPFHPHVTLVRNWRGQLADEAASPLDWRVSGASLMVSESTARGVRYRELARADFP